MTRSRLALLCATALVLVAACGSPGGNSGFVPVSGGDAPVLPDGGGDVAGTPDTVAAPGDDALGDDASGAAGPADAPEPADAPDGAVDALPDPDAAADTSADAAADATADAGPDAPADGGPDAPTDATSDAGPDAGACTPGELRCLGQDVQACTIGAAWATLATCPAGQPCFEGACCVPSCAGAECGTDGCGGSCGTCGVGLICVEGACDCVGSCEGKACGDDGCGNACGACGPGEACVDFACVCQPACAGKSCGPDGCGGSCGTCEVGEQCKQGQCACTSSCGGKACGPDGCGGSCGTCPGAQDTCEEGACVCVPACEDAACGPDGCGGACGTCDGDETCVGGVCLPPGGPVVLEGFDGGQTLAQLGWTVAGKAEVVEALEDLTPPGDGGMLLVSSWLPEGSSDTGSVASFETVLPAGTTRVVFVARLLSEEWVEWCGSQFADFWSFGVVGGQVSHAVAVTTEDVCAPPTEETGCDPKTVPCDFTCLVDAPACAWDAATGTCTGSIPCSTGRFVQALEKSAVKLDQGDAYQTAWLELALELGGPVPADTPVKISVAADNLGDAIYHSLVLVDEIRAE